MARTPQFRSLIRALQLARQRNLEAAGHPAAVVRPGTRVSRRQFLRAGAATAAATGLSVSSSGTFARAALVDDATAQQPARIAVIGAGLAGLNAALRLQDLDLGYQVTLYEARDRVGGRCHSVTAGPGYVLDLGGSFINSDHADMLDLLRKFDLYRFDRIADAADVGFPTDAFFFGGRRIPEVAVADALRPLAAQITADAALLDQNWSKWASKFDVLSVTQYLDQHRDKIRAPFARTLMENAIRTEYGVEPQQSSALQLLFLLPVVSGQHVEVLGYSDEQYTVKGGVGQLPRAMDAALGDRVQLGRVLTRVEDRMSVYRLTFADGVVVEVDAVVIAIPVSLLRTIDWVVTLPAQFRRYIDDVDLGRNEKTFVGFDPKVWRSPDGFVNGLWTDQGYSAAWDGTQRQNDRPDGALTFYFGGDEVRRRPGAPQLVRRFDDVIDGAAEAYTGFSLATDWANERFTRGAYVNFGPGELTTYGGYFWIEGELSVAFRNLAFAGEHFSDLWYGFMNGAAETGRLAADYLAKRLGGGI
jgi:monoamine oxidase